MRISTGYQFDTYSREVSSAQQKVFEAQRRVQTGKRLNRPSDDPTGSASVVRMSSLRNSLDQYQANVRTARGSLGATENAYTDLNDLTRRAYELALRGANSVTDQSGREGMAVEVAEIMRRVADLANTRDPQGDFLFGGQRTNAAPYTVMAGTLAYNGDAGTRVAEASATETVVVGGSGEPMMGELYSRLEGLRQSLLNGDVARLSDVDVRGLQGSMDSLRLARGAVGAKLRQLEETDAQHTRRRDELEARVSDVEEIDMSQAIMDFRLAEAAYEASLNVASQGFRLSLMDFIRG